MYYNPLEDPVPDDPIQRIHAFARDLAYGAAHALWAAEFEVGLFTGKPLWTDAFTRQEPTALAQKWEDLAPHLSLLVSFGYLAVAQKNGGDNGYILTGKAFSLLEQPAPAPIFISYRRQESSAFALLLLARFKTALGLEPFLDMNIEPGDDWHRHLENRISQSEHFICLMGPTTLDSWSVVQEIKWAIASDSRIIPVWHNGFSEQRLAAIQRSYPGLEEFFSLKPIRVEQENPIAYESAVIQLMNKFGVTP